MVLKLLATSLMRYRGAYQYLENVSSQRSTAALWFLDVIDRQTSATITLARACWCDAMAAEATRERFGGNRGQRF